MVAKPPGRNRPVDVAISLDHNLFIERLVRATRWSGSAATFQGDGDIRPGAPKGLWCTDDPGRFAVEYLWQEVFSKYDDGKTSEEKEISAMKKFREAEEMCVSTNARLSRLNGLPSSLALTFAEQALVLARSKLRTILGKFSWDEASRGFSFTSGASTRLPRVKGQAPYKFSGIPETTFGNVDLAYSAICWHPAWRRSLCSEEGPMALKLVIGNHVTSVPKNYKVNRIIAKEPDMNMYVQKGIATMIRGRLKRAGMDLNSQERNQRLARVGSVAGSLATIDLSMASDTLSLELVRFLYPPQWCAALEQCRSSQGVLPSGEIVLYRKFSSMGNGATFELESSIFWALALAVCQLLGLEAHRVVSYGDDIIVPTAAATPLIDVLSFCGFKTNEDKTFISGGFRESCGKHYLDGIDVTPFYVKKRVTSLTGLFLLHNRLYRWAERQSDNPWIDRVAIREILGWLRSLAPANWRKPRIPDGYGDGAFIGTFDEAHPTPACTLRPGKVGMRDGWEGFICRVIADVAVIDDFYEEGYGRRIRKQFRASPNAPDVVGRLLQALSNAGRHHDDPVPGGVSGPPRARVVDILVPQFAPS